MSQYIAPTEKLTVEAVTFTFPLGGRMPSGRGLVSASVSRQEKASSMDGPWTTSTDLTIGGLTVSGTDVQGRIAGGSDGVFYRITITATDDAGDTPGCQAFFVVRL